MINWAIRFKNKAFWLALVPAVFLFIQAVMQIFGFNFDFTELSTHIVGAIEALFVVLTIIGVVADPTTEGISDSERALGYKEPAPNAKEAE